MFDFRYHALSLTAVFIALAVGLLLGVAIGDSGLVSSAERNIRDSLRQDVSNADRRVKAARADIAQADRFQREVYPLLVDAQLEGRTVGLVFLGESDKGISDDVKAALRDTGATIRSVAATGTKPDFAEAGRTAVGTRYDVLAATPEPDLNLIGDFGFRVGAQYVRPGRLLQQEKPVVFDTFNGDLAPVDAVIVVHDRGELKKGYGRSARDRFDEQLVKGIKESRIPVVGVERSTTDPSQISWYKDRGISSVDDVDETSGRAALVFALQGREGAFGRKGGADGLLPDVVGTGAP
ncbi:MAG: hypothetical protein JWO02_2489 [Solirubrobacterales bacterium]|nr:hypothetical protein [Solirubrobacterales bacterium]